MVDQLAAIAAAKWGGECDVQFMLADTILGAVNEYGERPEGEGAATMTCPQTGHATVWLAVSRVAAAQTERPRPGRGGDSEREQLCRTVIHEVGHTRGLEHTESGIMSPDAAVPSVCKRWRASLDRSAKARARKARAAARRHRAHRLGHGRG